VHFGYHGVKMIGLKHVLHVPMVCSFYGDDAFSHPLIGNTKQKYQLLFREADRILVLGPYMKSRLIELGCSEQKIDIHHLGIDVDKIRFEKRNVTKGDKVRFLIASSFVEKKGIDLAIRALSVFKKEYSFSLDIIGDGPLKKEIMEVIEQCDLKDRVMMHGYKPYDFLINLAYSCDVFIQASRTGEDNRKEGTPMVIVDVMATGMAVVSTRHSDIPEIVVDGETGYLAEENDVRTLTDCIQNIFTEPERIGELGLKGRARAEKEFNARIQTERLEELYAKLVEGR
jgi:colanic acid/amylovoran biosynthesis glycosyltransferase